MTDVSLEYEVNPFTHSQIYTRFGASRTNSEIMDMLREGLSCIGEDPHYSRVGDPDGQIQLQEIIGRVYGKIISLGYNNEPEQFGTLMFRYRDTCPVIDSYIERRMNGGVSSVELEIWWNMTPAKRFFGLELDHIDCTDHFNALCASGRTVEDALKFIHQRYPYFGNPELGQGDNRPLPIEFSLAVRTLWNRQNQYLNQWSDVIRQGGTFNMFLRRYILAERQLPELE